MKDTRKKDPSPIVRYSQSYYAKRWPLSGGKDTDAWNAKRFLIILGKRAQALGLFTTLPETAYDCFVIISLIM